MQIFLQLIIVHNPMHQKASNMNPRIHRALLGRLSNNGHSKIRNKTKDMKFKEHLMSDFIEALKLYLSFTALI